MKDASSPQETSFGLLVFSISLAIFMSSLDGTIVNIALPTISEAFGISSSTVSWVATAYMLVLAGCILVFGRISDVVGLRSVFLSGFAIFSAGSFFCGMLPDLFHSFPLLVASRVFQAIGGAMMTAIAPAMVSVYVPGERRGAAMGMVMTLAALGTALGPAVGGVLTQYLSWNWIFLINVPIGMGAVLLGARVIPPVERPAGTKRFDVQGAILVFCGLAALIFSVTEAPALGWTSPVIVASVALSGAALLFFVRREVSTDDPILDLRLFLSRNFSLSNLILALVFLSFAGISYLLPFFLEYVKGFPPSVSGLILTAFSAGMMVGGIVSGFLYNRAGPRPLSIGAAVILLAGYFMMWHLKVDTTTMSIVACLITIGLGMGLLITPLTNMIMNAVPRSYQGMVSSLTSLERYVPITLGIAIFNLVFIQGVTSIARHRGVTASAPATLTLPVLAAGFDLAFFGSFLLGLIIVILTLIVHEEVHPDFREGEGGDGADHAGEQQPFLGI